MSKKITYFNEEKYIYITSNLFIIPTLYGFYHNFYLLSSINFLSTLITSKFWKTGKNDIFRKIDIFYQPINGIIYFLYGNLHAKNNFLLIIGNLFFMNGIYFFIKSHIEYKKINRFWYHNHMVFHISMIAANLLTYKATKN